jgi:hypothetical protein
VREFHAAESRTRRVYAPSHFQRRPNTRQHLAPVNAQSSMRVCVRARERESEREKERERERERERYRESARAHSSLVKSYQVQVAEVEPFSSLVAGIKRTASTNLYILS